MRIRFYLPALIVLVFLAPGLGARAEEGRVFQSLKGPFQVVIIASGLDHPWSMAFLPDGDLLVTERSGELRLIRKGRLQDKPIKGLPEITDKRDQGGLLDVALDPGFDQNGRLCISYVAETEAGRGTEIGCGIFRDDRLVNFDVIFRAQDRGTHPGSVVRLLADGAVPPDNPFVGNGAYQPEVYTYGNRNPQGLAQDPTSGLIWMHEHGPRGGDELNLLRAGANYGWPVISYGKEYFLPKVVGEGTHKHGMEQPVHYWVPSIAPSGMAFYSGSDFPGWQNSLFLGSLKFQELVRLEMDKGQVVAEERLLSGEYGRIRDVRQGPEGGLYLLTDAAEGQLLKLVPAD